MNRLRLYVLLSTLALLLVATAALQPVVFAQQNAPNYQPSAQQDRDPAASPSTILPADAQTFVGKVSRASGKYVLIDDTTKATYSLDDQDRAKKFDGKSVKVTGKLDAQTNTIQVAAIEPAS